MPKSQLDEQTESNIQSLDSKISREQSQYDEYYKQYEYYEKQLSQKEDPKFFQTIKKLNLLNENINSLIDERNMLLFLYDDVFVPIEDEVESEPEKQLFCFLWWCW
jgi:chromosome segregation ATPase